MDFITRDKITEVSHNLLARTATKYPKIFLEMMVRSLKEEDKQGPKSVTSSIIENILTPTEESAPLYQDTGVPTFHLHLNLGVVLHGDIKGAIREYAYFLIESMHTL